MLLLLFNLTFPTFKPETKIEPLTKKPHTTLSAATHREQPTGKVEIESGRKWPGNESSKSMGIIKLAFCQKSSKNLGRLLVVLFSLIQSCFSIFNDFKLV